MFGTQARITYIGSWNSPDLKVVRTHENLVQAFSNVANIPLIKVAGLVCGSTHASLEGSIDKTVETLDLLIFGQQGNVVLERIGDPAVLVANVRDTLVFVPVGGVG